MANETPHSVLGFAVQFDGLIQRGSLHLNPLDWEVLKGNAIDGVKFIEENDIKPEEHTGLIATSVGPISGPDAGTGPLIPVGYIQGYDALDGVTAVKLPFTGHDDKPNAMSPILEDQQNDAAGERVSDANAQPYPTADVPAVPTSSDPEDQSVEHTEDPQLEHFEENQPEHKDGE